MCSICGELGWEDKRYAYGERQRVERQLRRLALGDAALTIRRVYYCGGGLWHLSTPTAPPGP